MEDNRGGRGVETQQARRGRRRRKMKQKNRGKSE